MPSPIPIIVHFVGIALFSNQVPNDCGLKVIMPKIVYAAPAKTGTAATHSPSAHVENHQAVLIFRKDSYVPSSSNWGKPTLLPKTGTVYEYVKLDGDRVRFDGGIDNQSVDFERPQLPPLGVLCPAMTSLDKRFEPPYSGAAAVFDLPQGVVRGCNAAIGRIDTEVKFNGDTGLVISASTMKTRKELRLKPINGKVELIVANIPVTCLKNGVCPQFIASATNVSHVHAYYQMASQSASCNKTITDWIAAKADVPTADCLLELPPGAGGPINPKIVPEMTDFECSNSRYP